MMTAARKRTLLILRFLGVAAALTAGTAQEAEQHYGIRALLDGRAFARIPAGEFLMGSKDGNGDERPAHRVRISRGFEMGKYEVSQAQWEAVMIGSPAAHAGPRRQDAAPAEAGGNPSYFKGASLPVENVSWDDAQEFIRLLNARDHSHQYRLPTEAEWEYACRAGGTGDQAGNLDAVAWHRGNSGGQTHPVGQKQPNAWGLYDMHGNVLEWVGDWYRQDYYQNRRAVDPQGPPSASYRVYRGGSWYSSASDCRSAFRGFDLPANHYYSVGFRLVRAPK